MIDDEKVDLESGLKGGKEGSSVDNDSTTSQEDRDFEQGGFQPIQPAAKKTNNHLQRPTTAGSTRSRASFCSNNGFGVDELVDEEEERRDRIPMVNDNEKNAESDGSSNLAAAAPVVSKDPFEVGWDGDDDKASPRNMPFWRKWVIVAITSVGSFVVTHASASYTASYAQMMVEFNCSRLVATLGLSSFVLGIAMGPFWSPLAEFYGRRPIYLCSFIGFLIFLIPTAVAQNIETVIVTRFLQGMAGSAFLSVSGGTVGDMFTRNTMQAPMAIFATAPFVGPATGPLAGGLINMYAPGWRWTHYVLMIMGGIMLVLVTLFIPETYHPVLLKRKATKLRKETGDDRYFAPIEKSTKSIPKTVAWALLRPFQLLFLEPMCLVLDVYSAVLLGVLYLFFGAFPLVFGTNYGFNLWQIGLTFMGLLVAMVLAACSTPVWGTIRDRLAVRRGLRENAESGGQPKEEPEDQLPSVIVGAPLITSGLFIFGFTTYPWVHWIFPVIGSAIFGVGTLLAFTGIFTFLVDAYPRYAASALAGNALVRCSFAAAFPLFGIYMYEGLGFQWAIGVIAFITLGLMPFPYIFFVYGKRLRGRSRFAKS